MENYKDLYYSTENIFSEELDDLVDKFDAIFGQRKDKENN